MKKYWNYFTDIFGLTFFHPQYFMNKYNFEGLKLARMYSKNKSIIDFGCGRMKYKSYLLHNAQSYFGIDHPTEHLNYISDDKPDMLTDFEKVNINSNTFDTAIMFEVLEYLDNPSAVLDEIFRILKPNGKFVMTAPFMYPIHDSKIDKNRFTKVKISLLLKKARFKNIKIKYQGNFAIFFTNSILVYYFKKIMSLNLLLLLFLLPFGILISTILNFISSFFTENEGDFPINIIITANK